MALSSKSEYEIGMLGASVVDGEGYLKVVGIGFGGEGQIK